MSGLKFRVWVWNSVIYLCFEYIQFFWLDYQVYIFGAFARSVRFFCIGLNFGAFREFSIVFSKENCKEMDGRGIWTGIEVRRGYWVILCKVRHLRVVTQLRHSWTWRGGGSQTCLEILARRSFWSPWWRIQLKFQHRVWRCWGLRTSRTPFEETVRSFSTVGWWTERQELLTFSVFHLLVLICNKIQNRSLKDNNVMLIIKSSFLFYFIYVTKLFWVAHAGRKWK